MSRNWDDYTKEELIEELKKLKKQKKFGLVWEDKPEAVVKECETKLPVVKEVEEKAIENAPGEPTSIIIEGDNYHALSVLNYTHAGKVDVIYIDPPYNTGNKDFIYNDCYVDKEDSFRHSKWLSFMEKRLKLAKNLLADDGVIFISIDDNEQAHLVLLCDKIFGEENRLSNISVVNNLKGRSDDEFFATAHESLVSYAKKRSNATVFGFPMSNELQEEYKYSDSISNYKEVGLQKTGKNSRRIDRPNMYYPIYYNEKTKSFSEKPGSGFVEIYPTIINGAEGCWRWGIQTFIRKKETELIAKNVNGQWRVYVKMRDIINGKPRTIRPKTIWIDPRYDTGAGGRALKAVLGINEFSSPKPVEYIKDIFRVGLQNNGIVLDFFAGSGTTGQAVMELNKEDGGHRQFILVTNNENQIAENVTYPRVKTVITGVRQDGSRYSDGIPANLRYFRTDFVEKGKTTDDTREALITECCDMIRIRENAFEYAASTPEYRFYKNDKVFVPIIFDQFAIAETWEKVEELNAENLPVHCYNFSYNRHANEEEIPEDTKLEWTACSIPETVLEVYKKIFRKKEA